MRRLAYDAVAEELFRLGVVSEPVWLTDIDDRALAAWRRTWFGRHPSGDGGWSWETIIRPFHRRPSAFHLAVWSGNRLCALAAGRASKRRSSGRRHTISIHYLEAIPRSTRPFVGQIAVVAISAAEEYGRKLGASRVRLINPLPGVLPYYLRLGFTVAREDGSPVYCERGIR